MAEATALSARITVQEGVRSVTVLLACALGLLVASTPTAARAWDPFLRENPDVEDGNAAAAEDDYEGALAAYGRAARKLPDEPGVHLNRGLALLRQGKHAEARQALLLATSPEAPSALRADAYYNLGLSFYQSGDELAEQMDHQQAQEQFREAVDSLRRSLRARPGDPSTAWNYELARRRLAEQTERAEEQQEEQDAEEEQDGQEDGSDSQDAPSDQQEGGDSGEENESPSDNSGDSESNEGSSDQTDDQGTPEPDGPSGQDDSAEEQAGSDQTGDEDDGGDDETASSNDQEGEEGSNLPSNVERVLDALQNSEENLQRYRARARARQQNRQPTMDW